MDTTKMADLHAYVDCSLPVEHPDHVTLKEDPKFDVWKASRPAVPLTPIKDNLITLQNELEGVLKDEVDAGRLSPKLAETMQAFCEEVTNQRK